MIAVTWTPREEPLAVEAAFARGEASQRLARRLLAHQGPTPLRAVAGEGLLVILGDDLPWVEGIVYLGRDAGASQMYLPTVLAPSVVPALLARAIERRMPAPAGPFALVDHLIIPLAAALPLDRSRLESWLAA
jgi:hypothetical protein